MAIDLLLCGHAQDTAVSLPEEVQARLPLCEVEHARPIRGATCEGSAQNGSARGHGGRRRRSWGWHRHVGKIDQPISRPAPSQCGRLCRRSAQCRKRHRNIRVSQVSFDTPAICKRRHRRHCMLDVLLRTPTPSRIWRKTKPHSFRSGVSV